MGNKLTFFDTMQLGTVTVSHVSGQGITTRDRLRIFRQRFGVQVILSLTGNCLNWGFPKIMQAHLVGKVVSTSVAKIFSHTWLFLFQV